MEFTLKQMNLAGHALGVDFYSNLTERVIKDRLLPKLFYRNHYQVDNDEHLNGLCLNGYATKREVFGQPVYHISELGKEQFSKQYNEIFGSNTAESNTVDCLKKRIDCYCQFCGYTFNHTHVFEEYKEKFSQNIYVSHTTKDAIRSFLFELKKYNKLGVL